MNDTRGVAPSSSIDPDKFVSIFAEFIECAVHCILKSRKIYPDALFEKRMKYGVSIWRCRHPDIAQYIEKVNKNCIELMRLNLLDSIVFACKDPVDDSKILDKIVFKVEVNLSKLRSFGSSSSSSSTFAVNHGQHQSNIHSSSSSSTDPDAMHSSLLQLEVELRSCLLKLLVLDARLPALPVDTNWSLAVVTKDTSSVQMQEQLREVLRMGQWLAEPIGTQLSEQGATNTNTGGDRNSGSGIGNQQFIPLSSYHDRTVTMSINYLQYNYMQ